MFRNAWYFFSCFSHENLIYFNDFYFQKKILFFVSISLVKSSNCTKVWTSTKGKELYGLWRPRPKTRRPNDDDEHRPAKFLSWRFWLRRSSNPQTSNQGRVSPLLAASSRWKFAVNRHTPLTSRRTIVFRTLCGLRYIFSDPWPIVHCHEIDFMDVWFF